MVLMFSFLDRAGNVVLLFCSWVVGVIARVVRLLLLMLLLMSLMGW